MKSTILVISLFFSLSSYATYWVPLIKCYNNYYGESLVFDADAHSDSCQVVVKNPDLKAQVWNAFHIGENHNGEIVINCSTGYYGDHWDPVVEGQWGYKRGININHKDNNFHMYDYPNNLAVYFHFDHCNYY